MFLFFAAFAAGAVLMVGVVNIPYAWQQYQSSSRINYYLCKKKDVVMEKWKAIEQELASQANDEQALHLMRFFKTGEGQYGFGDNFLGLKVPQTRAVVRDYRSDITLHDALALTRSRWHEVRLAGFLLLVELYKKSRKLKDDTESRNILGSYFSVLGLGNNWDLVDLVAPKILGDWLVFHPHERTLLYQLAAMDGHLWHQRVAIVSCWTIIRSGDFSDTFRLCTLLINHRHDLIHKACGWMLREVGKRGGRNELIAYLDQYATQMPRTMLRYAIEHLPEDTRQYYLKMR